MPVCCWGLQEAVGGAGGRKGGRGAGFEIEEIVLGGQSVTAGIATDAVAGDDAVARDEDGDRVAAVGGADGAGAAAGDRGDIAVGAGGGGGDFAERAPDAAAIFGAFRVERKVEREAGFVEVFLQLLAGTEQEGGLGLVAAPAPVEGDDGAVFLGDGQVADGRVERKLGHARIMSRCGCEVSWGALAVSCRFCQAERLRGGGAGVLDVLASGGGFADRGGGEARRMGVAGRDSI